MQHATVAKVTAASKQAVILILLIPCSSSRPYASLNKFVIVVVLKNTGFLLVL
jgi:hypothetical protein